MIETFQNDSRVLEPLWFEKLDLSEARRWVEQVQFQMIYVSIAYVILAHLGRAWMKDRKPYDLRRPLFVWNAVLAVFSIFGFCRTFPNFFSLLLQPNGIYRSVCTRDNMGGAEYFWGLLYTLSKPLEFIDTAFIILKKAPLLFLHWYHHMSMNIFMFYLYPLMDPVGRWGGILNSFVHSVMYTYYALKTAGVKIPKRVSSMITSMQMGQFVFALLANVYALAMMGMGEPCILSTTSIVVQLIGGISYLLLFANYYYQTYVRKKPKSA